MDFGIVVLSALLGAAAGGAIGYSRNWIAGWAVPGIGAIVLFSASGGGGPGGTVDNFFETVGPIAGFTAVIGAVIGLFAGDRMRSSEESK